MGNCLQSSDSEDINLVRSTESEDHHIESNSRRESDEGVVIPADNARHANFSLPTYEHSMDTGNQSNSSVNVYHPSPSISRTACQLTEEEQVKIAQRIGLIHHLSVDIFVEANKTDKECIICMMEFCEGDRIRFLPCLHTFHVACIDDWLMRSFTCPSCLEPVDSALLTSYDQQSAIAFTTAPLTIGQQLRNIQGASEKSFMQKECALKGSIDSVGDKENSKSSGRSTMADVTLVKTVSKEAPE